MTSFVWTVVAVALTLLALTAWSFYSVWVELRAIRREFRGLRQQVANVIAMLQHAGFKSKRGKDWSDDGDKTVAAGLGTETKWDWRRPDAG